MALRESQEIQSDWLKEWAKYAPHSVAFKDADSEREWTYAHSYFLSCRLALELRSRFNIEKGDRVACLATNAIEYVALLFAVQRLGAILVPVNFRLMPREIAHILRDCGAKLLVAQSGFASIIEQIPSEALPKAKWAFDGDESLAAFVTQQALSFASSNVGAAARRISSDESWELEFVGSFEDACMILYTSGTTGAPKGAIITNKVLHWNSLNTSLRLDITHNDVNLAFLPFFHTSGWNVLLTPFVHKGACSIIMKKFDATRVLELYEKERVTIMFGIPTILDMMARSERFAQTDLSSVRYAIVGGEPMPIELIKTFEAKGVPIRQGFGMTEFGPSVFSLNAEDAIRKIGSIGFPNFYVDVRVVDDHGQDVAQGEIGELLLKGPACSPGYWNNPEATAQAIKDGWFHTGDLVRFDDEGYYYVAGRKKDMFISGGENVYPTEVERFLSTHPSVREVAVLGVSDAKWGEVGKAFVSLKPGHQVSGDELAKFCDGHLARYKIPKHFEFLADLPKGDSGKILKSALVSK